MKINTSRDGALTSPWQNNTTEPIDNGISTDAATIFDCLIVGGGITGLTAALLLQNNGKRTIVADAHTVGFGTTGGTSAHINTFADTTYSQTESAFGADGAKLFAKTILEGCNVIKSNVDNYNIDCDYEVKQGFIYAETDDEAKQMDDVYNGILKVGVAVEYTNQVPTPVPFQKALLLPGQAQFHPLKYLSGLKSAYLQAGGIIKEHTLIEKIDTADNVHTAVGADIKAKAVIYATHLPPNINVFNFECAPYRSYVIAVKLKSEDYPDALIYDSQDPYHYVRTHIIDGEKLLLVGGADHKTGHEDPQAAFNDLEAYVRRYYDVSSIANKWSSQYYVPVDGLPYIGQMPLAAKGVYCATGYNGNGMMFGSVAGKILAELIAGEGSEYEKIFNPGRVKPIDGFSEFVKENADVAYRFVADRFKTKKIESLNSLRPGTGRVIELEGEKVAAYCDEQGKVHALSPVCTHAGCIVNWNGEEKTWDCPCHGARYNIDGEVLTGPATRSLAKIESEDNG